MLLESPTDSWLAPKAHRREIRRARWSLQSTHRRRSRHLTRRPRRGGMQCRRAELSSVGGPAPSALCDDAGLDAWPACRVVRAHDCVRLKEPNDVNRATRPSEHCSKQSSHSPMPPLSSRLPAPHSSLTRNNMKGRQFPCLEKSLCITASRKSSSRRLHRSAHSDSNQNDLHCR